MIGQGFDLTHDERRDLPDQLLAFLAVVAGFLNRPANSPLIIGIELLGRDHGDGGIRAIPSALGSSLPDRPFRVRSAWRPPFG